MLTLERLREIDPNLASVSDEELVAVRRELYSLAEIVLDSWENKEGSKNPEWLSPQDQEKSLS